MSRFDFVKYILIRTNKISKLLDANGSVSVHSIVRYNLCKKIQKSDHRFDPGKIGLRRARGGHRNDLGRVVLHLPIIPETIVQELLLFPHSQRNESYEHPGIERRGIIGRVASETHRDPRKHREERVAKVEIQDGPDQGEPEENSRPQLQGARDTRSW